MDTRTVNREAGRLWTALAAWRCRLLTRDAVNDAVYEEAYCRHNQVVYDFKVECQSYDEDGWPECDCSDVVLGSCIECGGEVVR